ncbi:unnamed protein product [Leptidea sinapis]|uniref:Uncharacterized protein n=1 Tax=Leptidea sinapis TaxID=189913 RepID=A0A5E4PQ00_9NEOP|nr:unnamed protein product [Leptidea sinapis]
MFKICCIIDNSDTLTKETLLLLQISLNKLPQKSKTILESVAKKLIEFRLRSLDRASITLLHSKELTDKLHDDYEILKLKQKNEELQMKINQNEKFIDGLRQELETSKKSLANGDPNPKNINEHIRQIKLRLATYEECYEKTSNKYASLGVPDSIMPQSLMSAFTTLATLRHEAAELKLRADDVLLVRDAKANLRIIK